MKKKLGIILFILISALFLMPLISQKILHYSINKTLANLEKRGVIIYNPTWIDNYGQSIFKAQINFRETELKSDYSPLVLLTGKIAKGVGFWGNNKFTSDINLLFNSSTVISLEPQVFLYGVNIKSQKLYLNHNLITSSQKSYLESEGGSFQTFQLQPFKAEFFRTGNSSEIKIPFLKINNFLELKDFLLKDFDLIKQEIQLGEFKSLYLPPIQGLLFNWQLQDNALVSSGQINSLYVSQLSRSFPLKFELKQALNSDDMQAIKNNNPLLVLFNKFKYSIINPEYLLEIGNKDFVIENKTRQPLYVFDLNSLNGATIEINPNFANQTGLQTPLMFMYGSPILPTNSEGNFKFKLSTENGNIKLLKIL